MATSEYIDSVVALADKTLDAYQPDSLLHRALQPLDDDDRLEDGTLFATIEGGSKDLRSVTAVLGAVQLAFDAAMVVVSYAAELPGGDEDAQNTDFLRNLASNPTWTLEIEELADGTFKASFKALFTTKRGRSDLLQAATIATVILAGLVPPLGLPLLVVTGLAAAVTLAENTLENEDILENTVEKLLDRRQERQAKPEPSEPTTPKTEKHRSHQRASKRNTRNVKLQEEITRLQNEVAGLTNQVVDLQAARAANVTVIRFEVAAGGQAVA
jgi:hypothetical protein